MGICFLLLLFCSLVADDGEAGANHPGTKIANAKGVALALNPEKKRIHSPRTFHACLISGGALMTNLPCIGETSQQEHGQKEYHDLLHIFSPFRNEMLQIDVCLFVRNKIRHLDSNQDSRNQNPLSCHWTMPENADFFHQNRQTGSLVFLNPSKSTPPMKIRRRSSTSRCADEEESGSEPGFPRRIA